MVLQFACSVAVLVIVGFGSTQGSFEQIKAHFEQYCGEVIGVAGQPPTKGDVSLESSELTRAEKSALVREMIARRTITVNKILGEITAEVMPEATGYVYGEDESGFEVKESTYEGVDKILSSYMADPDPEVRTAAYYCLQWYIEELPQLKEHIWVGAMDPDGEVANSAAYMLEKVKFSATDAPNLIYLLHYANPSTKGRVLLVMRHWGQGTRKAPDSDKAQLLPAVPILFELLDSDHFLVPSRATEVLRYLGPLIPERLDQTLEMLKHGDPQQEQSATSILRGMGRLAISALPQLVSRLEADPTLRDNGYYFQYKVAQAILDIEPELVDMVALKMAKNMGEQSDIGYLEKYWIIENGHNETEVLRQLGPRASAAIPLLKSFQVGTVDNAYLNATEALSHIAPDDPDVISALIKMIYVEQDEHKYWIIDGLGRATTNFELARPGLELVVSGRSEKNRDRAQKILDQHPLPEE